MRLPLQLGLELSAGSGGFDRTVRSIQLHNCLFGHANGADHYDRKERKLYNACFVGHYRNECRGKFPFCLEALCTKIDRHQITTTCIPTLAPLFKYYSERTTQKTSSLGYISGGSNTRKSKKTMELSFMQGGSKRGTSAYCAGTGRDSDSEENILTEPQEVHQGIQMKKDFQVEVSSAHSQ